MPDISSLTADIDRLSRDVAFWNTAIIVLMIGVAAVATGLVLAQQMAFKKADALAVATKRLSDVKESISNRAIADAGERAATANKAAGEANERAAEAQLNLARLQKESEARRLTGKQKAELTRLLKGVNGGMAIVSPMADGEASDFADDFDSAVKDAGWETLRIRNRLTNAFGVSVVTAEGTDKNWPPIKVLATALDDIGVPHDIETVKDGDASITPYFQKGYLYLVVEHKPLPKQPK